MIKKNNNFLVIKLLVLENTVNRLQDKIEQLEKQIQRLEKINAGTNSEENSVFSSPALIKLELLPSTPESIDIKDLHLMHKITSYDLMADE
jgi:hypothetical protein